MSERIHFTTNNRLLVKYIENKFRKSKYDYKLRLLTYSLHGAGYSLKIW
jgi:hypothetical protein